MKVIYDRRKAWTVDCPECKSTLEFNKQDIKTLDEEFFGEYHWHTYIKCPLCGRKIVLKIDNKTETIVKEVR